MDIDKLKKMNEMAVEFQKHNLASDSREAVAMADELYKKEGEENMIKDGGDQVQETEAEIMICKKEFEDIQKQVKSLVYSNKESNEKITMLISKMNEMIAEIKRIDKKVISLRSDIRPSGNEVQSKIDSQDNRSKGEEQIKNADELTSEDVSIEKYFYFGNK